MACVVHIDGFAGDHSFRCYAERHGIDVNGPTVVGLRFGVSPFVCNADVRPGIFLHGGDSEDHGGPRSRIQQPVCRSAVIANPKLPSVTDVRPDSAVQYSGISVALCGSPAFSVINMKTE